MTRDNYPAKLHTDPREGTRPLLPEGGKLPLKERVLQWLWVHSRSADKTMTDNNTNNDRGVQNADRTATLEKSMADPIKNFRAEYTNEIFPQHGGVVAFYRIGHAGDSELVQTIPLDFLEQVVLEWGEMAEEQVSRTDS